jgi:hypothetical protein
MHLRYISQDELVTTVQNSCPALSEQTAGADFYQITYALADRKRKPMATYRIGCLAVRLFRPDVSGLMSMIG